MSTLPLALFLDEVAEKIEDQPGDVIAGDDVAMALGHLAQVCMRHLTPQMRELTLRMLAGGGVAEEDEEPTE
jgi:hypothetical protein